MHPRENHSTRVLPLVCEEYAKRNPVEIIEYRITVTDSPLDFNKGRTNGENLVNQYVIPDLDKIKPELVIVGHDHIKGYGPDGFYIATPNMDDGSVELGESVDNVLSEFSYVQSKRNRTEFQATSITKVNKPIVDKGYRLFVFEIPQCDSEENAFLMSYRLFGASLRNILENKT
jgi:hypothetical protein